MVFEILKVLVVSHKLKETYFRIPIDRGPLISSTIYYSSPREGSCKEAP